MVDIVVIFEKAGLVHGANPGGELQRCMESPLMGAAMVHGSLMWAAIVHGVVPDGRLQWCNESSLGVEQNKNDGWMGSRAWTYL